jgi:hypothetical protein
VDQVKELTVAEVEQTYENVNLALAVTSPLRIIDALNSQIKLIEKRVKQQIKSLKSYQLLKTVSGIEETLVMTMMLEAGGHESLSDGRGLFLLLPVCGQCPAEQREKERQRQ